MIFYNAIEVLVTMLECTIGILFIGSIMDKSVYSWKNIIILSILLSSLVVLINQFKLFTIYTSFIGGIGIAICAKIMFDIKIVDAFILSVSYLILIHIIDFLSISILGTILNNNHFGMYVISNYSKERLYHILLTKMILMFLYSEVIRKYLKKTHALIKKMWGALIICVILIYYIGKQTFLEIDINIFMIWLLIFSIIFLGSYSLWQFVLYNKLEDNLHFEIYKNELILDKNKELIETNYNIEKYYHDLKNHNIVIENFIKDKEYSMAERYFNELQINNHKKNIHSKWTGIEILDYFLDNKKRYAENRKIKFIIESDLVKLNITDQELISLFGNAIDNAIESCEKISYGDKWIEILIKRVNDMIYIKISNTYDKEPIKNKKKYITSKKDERYHGIGIDKMRTIVSYYNGIFETEVCNNVFTVLISFFN